MPSLKPEATSAASTTMIDKGFIQELERLGIDLLATEGKWMHGNHLLAAAEKLRAAISQTHQENSEVEKEMAQIIAERDNYHEWADKLADAIGTHLGKDVGEHSNCNNPWAEALSALEQAQTDEIKWAKARDVGRYGDMSSKAHLRVGLDNDNDVYVSVRDESAGASIEFCTPGSGGGSSPKTRRALIALMCAIEEDNADRPDMDWWARRMRSRQSSS
jgi:hypothetical protein